MTRGEFGRRVSGVCVCALCFCTVSGFLSRYWFVFELCCHFRVQYIAMGLVAVPLCIRRPRQLSFVVTSLLLNLAACHQLVEKTQSPDITAEGSVRRILFANVDRTNRDFARALDLVHRALPDVAAFTEIDDEWASRLAPLAADLPYVISYPTNDKFGTVLFSRYPILESHVYQFAGVQIPSIALEATVSAAGETFRVVAAHAAAPTTSAQFAKRNNMLDELADIVRSKPLPTVVVADLNITFWSQYFGHFLGRAALRDARIGRGVMPTWPVNAPPLLIPIDHCLYNQAFVVTDLHTTSTFGSDHLGLLCDVQRLRR